MEPCLKDQESIYQATDGVKESTFKAYHAGYSANIGMCEGMGEGSGCGLNFMMPACVLFTAKLCDKQWMVCICVVLKRIFNVEIEPAVLYPSFDQKIHYPIIKL